MAVRRISDLPNLNAQYEDIDNTKCLIEVSYSARDNVYQSFYSTLDEIKNYISINADNLPKASKSQYGVVKIGNNIDVDDGVVSIPHATSTTAGVIKVCPKSDYVGIDSSGNLTAAITPEGGGEIKSKDIINAAYPVGSLWISIVAGAQPPGHDIDGITWEKLTGNYSLWNTSNTSEVGQIINGSLPFPNFTCQSSGNHRHGMVIKQYSGSFDDSAQTPGRAMTGISITAPQAPAIDLAPYSLMENTVINNDVTIDKYSNKGTKQSTTYGQITGSRTERISALQILLDKGKLNNKSGITDYSILYSFNAVISPDTNDLDYDKLQDAKSWAKWLIDESASLSHMGSAGAHTHTLDVSTSGSAYRPKNATDKTTVRPTSIGVEIWKRTR